MRCKGMKTVVKDGRESTKNCGKQATVFFRVRYRELLHHRDNGIMEDVFGFCEECAKDKSNPSGYDNQGWRRRQVLRLRGKVESVEPDKQDESTAQEGAKTVRIHDAKHAFLRIMETRGNRDLADEWPEVFRLAWDEFRIRAVMTK